MTLGEKLLNDFKELPLHLKELALVEIEKMYNQKYSRIGDNDMNLIKVENKELTVKEWNGQRVVTAWDIAKLHEREVRRVNENFEYVKDKLIENEDYFLIKRQEISESKFPIQDFIPNNVKEIPLFTESGYLMLVKTFTDDLSWNIQRALVKSYFTLKTVVKEIKQTEAQKKRLEIMDRNSRARMSKEFSKLATQIDNPKFKEILNVYAANTLADNEILPLPRLEQKTYTATELGNILGISGNMVGRLANEHNLKTDEYGYWAYDKSKHSSKQVESFRYFEHIIEKFREILKNKIA